MLFNYLDINFIGFCENTLIIKIGTKTFVLLALESYYVDFAHTKIQKREADWDRESDESIKKACVMKPKRQQQNPKTTKRKPKQRDFVVFLYYCLKQTI